MTKGKENAEDYMTDGGPGRTDIGAYVRHGGGPPTLNRRAVSRSARGVRGSL